MCIQERFEPFRSKMAAARLPDLAIRAFKTYYDELVGGGSGLIPESSITPPTQVPAMEQLEPAGTAGREALKQTVIIKLNGGLGTSMGLERAKTLLEAREGLTFLDIIVRQVLKLRERTGAEIPLVLMNSFSTHEDTMEALAKYPELETQIPLAFVQNRVPKVLQSNLEPAVWPADPGLEWCPPGHGDLYIALQTSGILKLLLQRGIRHAFVSNSDNLGAVIDERILQYFSESEMPFLMEVAERTEADKKGGHLARHGDGRLLLREVAQCAVADLPAFTDIQRYRYFNTNNIWLNLDALATILGEQPDWKLPLIRNSKTLDPRDPSTPAVYQLETAMGSAIEVFPGSGALRVPRTRFAPVKLCSDLLALWSDAYQLNEDGHVIPNPRNRYGAPVVALDPKFYKFVDQLRQRFPAGPPSLSLCHSFKVQGDVRFGAGVVAAGEVSVTNDSGRQTVVPDGTRLEGDVLLPG